MQTVLVIGAIIFFFTVSSHSQDSLTPKYQSLLQSKVLYNMTREAKELSDAAVPALLSYLDTPEFRADISNLPLANDSSSSLLQLLQEQIRISPLVHNMNSYYSPNEPQMDMTLAQLINSTYLYNYWELTTLVPELYREFVANIENTAETQLFAFPPFPQNISTPPTITEGQERPYYTAINIWDIDSGNPIFGGMGLVFFPDYAKPITFLNPMDTGIYEQCCGNITGVNECIFNIHCDKWNKTKGTLEYFNHLILPATELWGYTLGQLFQRWFQNPPPPLEFLRMYQYWEADFAGAALLPDSVQYIIASYNLLFGTGNGTVLQQFCTNNGIDTTTQSVN
eukprot:TRINITY_DN1733_c0_g1_i1.p1 TRINITY_DN1733_c0_g1~~TRINITY_DN1733_c0_g1_i1.p1  ORF type:complete len:347 (-),score=27.20 TRINITY_DN1733_c0_g1_i1:438-1454(-)